MWLWLEVASAATLRVGPTQVHTTIQSALTAAAAGDRIEVDPGTYTGPFTISRATTLVGVGGSSQTTLLANTGATVLQVDADLTLQGFTVNGQNARRGLNGSQTGVATLVVDGCAFRNGLAANQLFRPGGGMNVWYAATTVRNTTFSANSAYQGGAAAFQETASLVLSGNRFVQNHATHGEGGAVFVDAINGNAVTEITDNLFARNEAFEQAAPYSYGGSGGALGYSGPNGLILERNTFAYNVASDEGGAVWAEQSTGTNVLTDNHFCENSAGGRGGAVALAFSEADTELTGNNFGANSASTGGAVWAGDWYGYGAYPQPIVRAVDNTFASNAPSHLFVDSTHPSVVVNNIFAFATGTAVTLNGGGDQVDYDLFWGNATDISGASVGVHAVLADPGLVGWSDDGDCSNDTPATVGAGIDTGHPGLLDADNSRSDIGSGP